MTKKERIRLNELMIEANKLVIDISYQLNKMITDTQLEVNKLTKIGPPPLQDGDFTNNKKGKTKC